MAVEKCLTSYKIGSKITVKQIPGMVTANYKVKPPFEAEIVGFGREQGQDRILIKIDGILNTDGGWEFLANPIAWQEVNGKSIDKSVCYLAPACFEITDKNAGPKLGKFKLEQQIKVNDKVVRILGYCADDNTYIVETSEGDKLTHEMIKKMDFFVAYEVPPKNGDTKIKCKVVQESELLKENKMSTSVDGGKLLETLKDDGKDAAYRIGVRTMSRAVQGAIIKMLQSQGYKKSQVKAIQEFLATEAGEAAIKTCIGYALIYIPGIKEDPRAQRMSKEFRVDGIAQAGNLVMEHLWPILMNVLMALPSVESDEAIVLEAAGSKKVGMEVLEKPVQIEEKIELMVENKARR